jgi:hypothetical protein
MSATFPTGLASIQRVQPTDLRNAPGKEADVLHNKICDEIEAMQAFVGVTESGVSGSVINRLGTVESLAQETADDPILTSSKEPWGLRKNPISGLPLIPNTNETSLISYYWAWPGTVGTARYGEHHLYAPSGPNNYYFGTILGVRGKEAYSVPIEVCIGLFRPGLYTLAASCAKTGTWTSVTNAGAMVGAYAWSAVAGSSIQAIVTGETIAVHQFMAANGGYAVVSVDGSYVFNSPLPVFTSTDLSNGICRSQDVGRRYLCSYLANSWSHAQVVAQGLANTTHIVTVEATGTKPAASTDYRVYVEALIGCSPTTSCANANTYMVPERRFVEMVTPNASSCHTVPMFAPTGSVDYKFIGSSHADNTASKEVSVVGPSLTINGISVPSPTAGAYYAGLSILLYQESTISHAASLSTPVLNRKRTYSAKANRQFPIMVDVSLTWLAAGVVNICYPLMYPLNPYDFQTRDVSSNHPVRAWLGAEMLGYAAFNANNNTEIPLGMQDYAVGSEKPLIVMQYDDCMTWASLVYEQPNYGTMFSAQRRYTLQDRADKIDKLYISSNYDGFLAVAVDDKERYICGWGGLTSDNYPA